MASDALTKELYPIVSSALKDKNTLSEYKTMIDKYIANNADKLFTSGPAARPGFSEEMRSEYIRLTGLSDTKIKEAVKHSKYINPSWFTAKPFNIANSVATRYFGMTNNEEYLTITFYYIIAYLYPPLHYRFFRYCNPYEACMEYTINNLSGKYKLKNFPNMWAAFVDMCKIAYSLHKPKLEKGDDKAYIDYINDIQTRMRSLLRNVSNEYYDNYENGRYLGTEHESFEEEDYREATSNSGDIENISNKVTSHLIMHGPDMQLTRLAAKMNSVSVNELRNYVTCIINEKHKQDIHDITENILYLFLFNTEGETHSAKEIGTNEFMIHCMKIYKKSNTTNKNIINVKKILDGWVKELGIDKRSNRTATIAYFRRALYSFMVLSIQKLG